MELVELQEELVEEILLRIPPDEPAYLIRASLVCKSWFRILSDRNFLGRYRVFHRTPPLLGYLHNLYSRPGPIPRFVQTSTALPCCFSEPAVLGSSWWWALDCRHGRVLISTFKPDRLVVWDPVTGDQQHLGMPPYLGNQFYSAAILCAAMDDACNHLNCHGGPFIVVFLLASVDRNIRAHVYSSETHVWGASTTSVHADHYLDGKQSLLVGGVLYFTLSGGKSIVKYELGGQRLSVMETRLPVMDMDTDTQGRLFDNMVMAKADDGGLGLIAVLDNCVYFWMQQAGTNDDSPRTRWVQHRVIKINTLPPKHYRSYCTLPPKHYRFCYYVPPPEVIGFAEDNDIIFINRDEGVFMLDLKSMHTRKIGERETYDTILPYVSFYTPGEKSHASF